uniref:Ig-like domain-containing protein n=1 Tax=Gadus morhua TaxID=8049 RepID=A0A8C5A517_GADMO
MFHTTNMTESSIIVLLLCKGEDRVTQPREDVISTEGLTVSLRSTNLFWYRQYPSSPPQFLIKEYMELSRFTLKKDSDKKMFHLEISAAAVTDSALYFCAVEPTVTGNTDSLYKNLTRNLKSICHYLKLWFRGGASGEVNSPGA